MAVFWSLSEKRKLLNLLTVYPLDAYKNIANKLKSKTEEQVEAYIEKLKKSLKKKSNKVITRSPLEVWQDVAARLVENESFDCANQLSKVMSMVSSFEEFPTTPIFGHPQPDYKSIYRFLSQILQDNRADDLEKLGHLESAVVLELLHGLMEVLSSCDTSVQHNVIRWKYQLMSARHLWSPIQRLLRKASENDFSDFIEMEIENIKNRYEKRLEPSDINKMVEVEISDDSLVVESTYVSSEKTLLGEEEKYALVKVSNNVKDRLKKVIRNGTELADQPGSSGEQKETTENPAEKNVEIVESENVKTANKDKKNTASTSGLSTSGRGKGIKDKPEVTVHHKSLLTSYRKPDFDFSNLRVINRPAWQHKRGKKGKYDAPEKKVTEIVMVMPPKDAVIVQTSTRKKKVPLRDDGKYLSLNRGAEKSDTAEDTEKICRVEHADTKKHVPGSLSRGKKVSESFKKEMADEAAGVIAKYKRKYSCLMNKSGKDSQWKKPKLYSMNPFCLPVSLLDLKTQTEEDQ